MNNVLQVPIKVDLGDGKAPIVMVDDEESDYDLVKRFYQRSSLVNPLLHFSNGAEFLAYLYMTNGDKALMPAIVLMDINMPSMNGFEALESVRSIEPFSTLLVVVMLTSSSDPYDKDHAAKAGANGYLVKPYNPRDYLDFFNSLNSA